MSRLLTNPELSDAREISFVSALLDLGGPQFAAEAAKLAGYGRSGAEAERAASLLLGAPRIARAITAEVRRRFDIATAIAFNTLLEICVNPGAPANARITAAQELLNRSSIGPVASRSLSISAHTGVEEFLAQLDAAEGREPASHPDEMLDVTHSFVTKDRNAL
jgi:hypothetical protein